MNFRRWRRAVTGGLSAGAAVGTLAYLLTHLLARSFCGPCKNCNVSTGTIAPRRQGKSRQDLGNPHYVFCRAPALFEKRE